MSTKFIDLTGHVYGKLTVLSRVENDKYNKACWLVRCECGTEKVISRANLRSHVRSCGCSRRGANSWRWRGGRSLDGRGYVVIYMPAHPAACRNRISEHRLVMEKYLGRYLTAGETVHHKNGVRDDNRIENLGLWADRHPRGQRVSDLQDWAHEILRQYPYMEPLQGGQGI